MSDLRKEEIRGLFVLGLLAVLSSIRIQNSTMIVTIGQLSFNIIPLLDITILLWSFYAFFMIFGLSEDMLGKTAASVFKEAAKMFLYFNFLVLASLSLALGYFAFPTRLPFALVMLSVLILYVVFAKVKDIRRKITKPDIKKAIKSSTSPLLAITILLSFTMIMFGANEYVVPFFIIGCVAIVSWLSILARKKSERKRTP